MNAMTPVSEIETIKKSGLFWLDYYQEVSGLHAADLDLAILHYLRTGAALGLNPSPLFHTRFYVDTHAPEGNPLLHHIAARGLTDPNPLFDARYYLSHRPEPLPDGMLPLQHFTQVGWHEHRDPHPLFEVKTYLAHSPDVAAAGHNPLAHYLTNGSAEGRVTTRLFDPAYYRAQYPDIVQAGIDPLLHYLEHGGREMRNPSPTFDTRFYVAQAGIPAGDGLNPLVHYKLRGEAEGLQTYRPLLTLSDTGAAPAEAWQAWMAARPVTRRVALPRDVARLTFVLPDADAVRGWAPALGALAKTLGGGVPLSAVAFGSLGKARHAATGTLFLFAQPGDAVQPGELAAALGRFGRLTELAVFDLFFPCAEGVRPVLLPGANRAQLQATDACHGRFMIHADLLARLAVADLPTPRAVLLAALRDLEDRNRVRAFQHLPCFVLQTPDLDDEIAQAGRQLMEKAADVSAPRLAAGGPRVSAVICSKEKGHLLTQLIDRLLHFPPSVLAEVVVVTNGPSNRFAQAYHRRLRTLERVRVIDYDKAYNFSAQSNLGARAATGELLLFINDDVIPIGDAWLPRLVDVLRNPRVGITGPLLLYPQESVQHAGMFLGFWHTAGHAMRAATLPDHDANTYALAPRNVSVITGAVFLTRRSLFEQLDGFDEQLGTLLQDVDFCLRASGLGFDIVYEPSAVLIHCESVSVRPLLDLTSTRKQQEWEYGHFRKRWGRPVHLDPFHNPAYDLGTETMRELR